jgi:hypothetical protein
MALFITGLILILIFGFAYMGPRLLDFTLVYDMLAQIASMLGMDPDNFIRIFPLVGAILMVLGNHQMLMSKVTCDQCGWQGPKRQFTRGCPDCGSKKWH